MWKLVMDNDAKYTARPGMRIVTNFVMRSRARLRRGEGTPPYTWIFKWGRRAASPLAAVPVYGSEKLCVLPLPTKSTVKGECRKPAGRACPAPA